MLRSRILPGMLCLVFLGGLLLAQDTPTVRPRGQLRQGWKQLGLTEEQVTKIYTIQADYRTKIAALEAQIKELKSKQETDEFKVLTEAQKARLKEIFAGKVPAEPKPDEKKP